MSMTLYEQKKSALHPLVYKTIMRHIDLNLQKRTHRSVSKMNPAPTNFPRTRSPSIVGVMELNCCVRKGNRWNLHAIGTERENEQRSKIASARTQGKADDRLVFAG